MPETQDIESKTGLPETAGGKELAALLGITDRQVRNLADEGVVKRAGRGRYLLGESVRAVIAQAESRASSALDAEKVALMAAKRKAMELKNAQEEGQLVPSDAADLVLSTVIGSLKAGLFGLPARVTRDIPMRRAIEAEVTRVLNAAAAKLGSKADEMQRAIDAADEELTGDIA